MVNSGDTKKRKLTHPLWTHLPAVAAVAVLIGYLIYAGPLPARAPIHFGLNGIADAYGSPWTFLGLTLGFFVLFTGLSVFLDELWARQEKKKTFNWLSFLDDIVVGWMTGISAGYLVSLHNNLDTFSFPWVYGLAVGGGAIVLALILELLRPFRAYRGITEPADTADFKTSITRQLKEQSQFVYWENQNPLYMTLVSVFLPLVFISTTVIVWVTAGWALFTFAYFILSVIIVVAAVAFIYGGQRSLVTREELSVRWGLAGLRVLRLNTAEIASAELMDFSPLRDFGGYGIRFGRGMKAYYLRGSRGVKITMANGKKYLVGSDHPERLLAVVELAAGK